MKFSADSKAQANIGVSRSRARKTGLVLQWGLAVLIAGSLFGCGRHPSLDSDHSREDPPTASLNRSKNQVVADALDPVAFQLDGGRCSLHLPLGWVRTSNPSVPELLLSVTNPAGDWRIELERTLADEGYSDQRTIDWIELKLRPRQIEESRQEDFWFGTHPGKKFVVTFREEIPDASSLVRLMAAYYLVRRGESVSVLIVRASAADFPKWESLFDRTAGSLRVEEGEIDEQAAVNGR